MRPMNVTLRLLTFCLFFITSQQSIAQSSSSYKGCKPPINRQLRHDYVDREQRNALRADGKADAFFLRVIMKTSIIMLPMLLQKK